MNNRFLAVLAALIALPSAALGREGLMLEEIVVTAQRREQNLQEVPISVTAFSGTDLLLGNIDSVDEYFSLTPNVSFSADGEHGGSRGVEIGIRGVNDLKSGENSVINSIGIYLDEFSVVSVPSGNINPFLPDMERIEVLRGPQGTYFGRNSLGGALNLTTRSPTDTFEGRVTFEGNVYDTRGEMGSGTLMLNVPISENFLTRGVFYYEDSSGKVRNINPDGVGTGHEYLMGRVTALWTPTERTTVRAMVLYTEEEQEGDEIVTSGVWNVDTVDGYALGVTNLTEAVDPEGIGFWPDNQERVSRDHDEFTDNESLIAVLNIRHELSDGVVLKSITGVIDGEQARLFDDDLVGGWDNFFRQGEREGTSYSTELRLEVARESYDWIFGVLYANDDQEQANQVLAGSNTAAPIGPLGPDPAGVVLLPPLPPGLCFLCDEKDFELESVAVFTDYTWHALPRLDLTVGGRYTHDEVSTAVDNFGVIFPDITLIGTASGEQTFDDFSPRFAARYALTDDLSVYGVISKGYKAGGTSLGFNADPVNVPLPPVIAEPFEEETVWNYELGFKSEWFDRRLRVNASAFYLDWSDLQLEVFRFLVPGNLQSKFALTTNIEEAEAIGFELEFAAAVTEHFSLAGGVGYLETEIERSGPQELSGGFIVNLEGLDIPKSPPVTANLVGEYRWPVARGEAWIRTEYIHRDGHMSNIEALVWEQTRGQFVPNRGMGAFLPATPGGFPFKTPDYDLVHLRAGYEWNDFTVSFYVNNLFDEEYYTGTAEDFSITGIRIRPNPRTFGAILSYQFGAR
jgi:iron complex outermembrane receptor protein